MSFITIRGATTVCENSVSSILNSTKELILEIEKTNNIDRSKVISILFSCTPDLDTVYPARAARNLGYVNASLMCFNEMYVKDSLSKCIRVMISYKSELEQIDAKHVYIKGAEILRPDLLGGTLDVI